MPRSMAVSSWSRVQGFL